MLIKNHFLNSNGKFPSGEMASSLLTRINVALSTIKNKKVKEDLKYILSEVNSKLIAFIISQSKESPMEIIGKIKTSTQTTIEINGWDRNDFKKYLPVDQMAYLSNAIQQRDAISKPVFYDWNCRPHELDELAKNLKSSVKVSVKEFKKLFCKPKETFNVKVQREELDFIMVLFDYLKERRFITPRGKQGHFLPLKIYLVDLDGKVLITEETKTLKFTIKKNRKKWAILRDKVEKWVGHFQIQKR